MAVSCGRSVKGEGKKRKSAEARVRASTRGSVHMHARSWPSRAEIRGRSPNKSPNENCKKEAISKSPQVSA